MEMAQPPELGGISSEGVLISERFSSNLDWDRDGKRSLKENFLVLGFGHPFQLQSRVERSELVSKLFSAGMQPGPLVLEI